MELRVTHWPRRDNDQRKKKKIQVLDTTESCRKTCEHDRQDIDADRHLTLEELFFSAEQNATEETPGHTVTGFQRFVVIHLTASTKRRHSHHVL